MELNFLQGKKTHIIAIATIMYALGGMVAGFVPVEIGIPLILGSLGLSGLRAGVTKPVPAFPVPTTSAVPGDHP